MALVQRAGLRYPDRSQLSVEVGEPFLEPVVLEALAGPIRHDGGEDPEDAGQRTRDRQPAESRQRQPGDHRGGAEAETGDDLPVVAGPSHRRLVGDLREIDVVDHGPVVGAGAAADRNHARRRLVRGASGGRLGGAVRDRPDDQVVAALEPRPVPGESRDEVPPLPSR